MVLHPHYRLITMLLITSLIALSGCDIPTPETVTAEEPTTPQIAKTPLNTPEINSADYMEQLTQLYEKAKSTSDMEQLTQLYEKAN